MDKDNPHDFTGQLFTDFGGLASTGSHELRFRSLHNEGRGFAFPCDVTGRVDLDALSERSRISYWFARTLVGRDYSTPAVRPRTRH